MSLAMLKQLRAEKRAASGVVSAPIACGEVELADSGAKMPRLGLGVYQAKQGTETYTAVLTAIRLGYRLIDTAELYRNEEDVGRAVADSGVARGDVFITTKFWPGQGHGYEKVIQACEASLKNLQVEYLDLYLLHSPGKGDPERLNSWKAMIELQVRGKVKSIGVSNYGSHHLSEIEAAQLQMPSVNQIELSPFLPRTALVQDCVQRGIVVEAYSPLTKGRMLDHQILKQIARKHTKTTAQKGFIVIPKSVREARLVENSSVFDFALDPEDMEKLGSLGCDLVTGWDPTKFP